LHQIQSSGSTGPPGKVYFNSKEISIGRAIQVLWWEWAGYKIGNSILQTGVNLNRTREKAIKDLLFKTTYIEALKHNENEILEVLYQLRKNPIDHFIGYASSLYLFAKVAKNNQIEHVKFISIISLGEKLLPHFRELIEEVFGCKVFDTYGASEGFRIASQCHEGNYHLMTPHVFVEIVDEFGNEVKPGESGTVLVTDLDNFTTPMIRYELGDMAKKVEDSTCKCGMSLPVFGEVTGRTTEFLVTPGKKYITVQTVVRVLKHFPIVEEFRLTQLEQNLFELEYVAKDEIGEVKNEIIAFFNSMFGEELNFKFERLPFIPKGSTGKFQLIRSKLPAGI
jgi:phenylacetate-CoA ligase